VIKTEPYGGGSRWHCTICDVDAWDGKFWITWTNSKPPKTCPACVKAGNAALAAYCENGGAAAAKLLHGPYNDPTFADIDREEAITRLLVALKTVAEAYNVDIYRCWQRSS